MAKLSYRIFVGDRLLDQLTAAERETFADKTAERMGWTLNSWFTQHIAEYQKVPALSVPETA